MANPYALQSSSHDREALATDVAWFPYMKSIAPTARRLSEVLDEIQNGKWGEEVARLRAIRADSGKKAYNREKERLPSFYISGTAATPTKMLTHTGMMQVDLDDLERLI